MNEPTMEKRPRRDAWPEDRLEVLERCPICGNTGREILHAELVDMAFRVAPGSWTLWRCAGCHSAYLDPRPTQDSIHAAYGHYYTHRIPAAKPEYETLSPIRKLRRRLVNGYISRRFGTTAEPQSAFGSLLLPLLWPQRRRVDCEFRHLPKRPVGGGTLLEMGFGSGAFLDIARYCGWTVTGVDPDGTVVDAARSRGFDVHQGGIEVFDDLTEQFDVIVMSHVIEHVHQPAYVLERCHQLLKAGGVLYVETPNLEGLGHLHFGRNWRGLESPRHLVLFTPTSLRALLQRVGFERTKWKARANPVLAIARASFAIGENRPIETQTELPLNEKRFVRKAKWLQAILPEKREYISWMAYKE